MLRHELIGRASGAALFLSALTIRPWPRLFNFQSNNIALKRLAVDRAEYRFSRRPCKYVCIFDSSRVLRDRFISATRHLQSWFPNQSPKEPNLTNINLPSDFNTNLLILFRWLHFVGGITWLGLLYFFNLVNVPFMKELDPATKGKILPGLMSRALWWFRWASVLTVVVGLALFGKIVGVDARNGGTTPGIPMASFFIIWTITWALMYACQIPGKGALDKGPVLAVIYIVLVLAASALFLRINDHGWESNQLLAIGVGGGMGWMMMLNVWGVIWRAQKKIIKWTADNAANGTAIPEKAKYLARQAFLTSRANFWLSFPLLFLMGASSHYPMFGK